ncbi:hypothetical protein RSAG8_04910, partial [Rhizoctonia solani AG-8 WAC10335]
MIPLPKLITIALLIASGTIAAPWSSGQSSTTHYTRALGPKQVKVRSYHPETTFKTYGITGIDHPLSKRGIHDSSSDAAKSFLVSETGTHSNEVAHRTGYTSNGISNEYFHQR